MENPTHDELPPKKPNELELGSLTTIGLATGAFILTWLDTKSITTAFAMLGEMAGLWYTILLLSTLMWAVCLSRVDW